MKDPKNNLDKAEYFLPSVVQALIQDNKANVSVLTTKDKWFGVTYQEDLLNVMQEIKNLIHSGVYPEQLWGSQ